MGTRISSHQLQQPATFNEIPEMHEIFRRRFVSSRYTVLNNLADVTVFKVFFLFAAVEIGDVDLTSELLRKRGVRVKINEKNTDQQTVLYIAVLKGNLELVELLLKHGADPNVLCKFTMNIQIENSKRIYCFLYGSRSLHNYTCYVDNVVYTYRTPLMEAAWLGFNCILRKLLKSKLANNNVKDEYGNTAVHFATVQNQLLCLDILFNNGANPDVANDHESFPIQYAAVSGNMTLLKFLIAHGCEVSRDSANPSFSALFSSGTDALFNAVYFGHFDCAMLLLEVGADVYKTMKNIGKLWEYRYNYHPLHADVTSISSFSLTLKYNEDKQNLLVNLVRAHGNLVEAPRTFIKRHILHPAVLNHDYTLVQLLFSLGLRATEEDYACAAANDQEIYEWLKELHKQPKSLKDLCRLKIRSNLGTNVLYNVQKLALPATLKNYITVDSPAHFSHLVATEEEN